MILNPLDSSQYLNLSLVNGAIPDIKTRFWFVFKSPEDYR